MTAKHIPKQQPKSSVNVPVTVPEAMEHYRMLCSKVDEFFGRVETRYADEMACRSGCNDCCHVRLTVTMVEAQRLRELWPQLPEYTRSLIRARAQGASDGLCVALQDDGRCGVYDARPLVCRSHGLPLRLRQERSLPIIDACFRNFHEKGPGVVAPDCVLDQQTLSTTLMAIDAAFSHARGSEPGQRVDLAALVASLH